MRRLPTGLNTANVISRRADEIKYSVNRLAEHEQIEARRPIKRAKRHPFSEQNEKKNNYADPTHISEAMLSEALVKRSFRQAEFS